MKYKQLAAQYKQELDQLKQAHEREIQQLTETIKALQRTLAAAGRNTTSEPAKASPGTPLPDLTDTSLTLEEAIQKYHAPMDSTEYSLTLWDGAHFEGLRACFNEHCPQRGK